jgi:prolyl 3-hydroxylase /prolyl 3,4-dihydroxylase
MSDLTQWINTEYLAKDKKAELKKSFAKAKPYSFLQLKDFLHTEKAVLLLKCLSEEQFEEKESDLFKLKQTKDFKSSKNKDLKRFREFLASSNFIAFMEEITGSKLKSGVVDCGSSLYESTDFLLPHDDQLEGRSIAYMLYFSDISKKEGGALELYGSKRGVPSKVEKSFQPAFNTFAFFKVSPVSFHQVAEVTEEVQRISINGWFHGK